jgi:HEAT repeat protein
VFDRDLRDLRGLRDLKEIEIGDEDFDKQVSVQGPPALALALLDGDMRRTIRAMLRGRLEVRGHRPLWASGRLEDGALRVDVPERSVARRSLIRHYSEPEQAGDAYLDGEYKLPQILRAALDLAARLVVPEDLARRIADNQAGEPEPHIRLQALLTLLREFPEHAATREAVLAARQDPDAEVRVRAGIALGADGRDVLLGAAGGEGAEDATSARAVAALDTSLTSGQAAELLKNALRTRRLATARACLGILGRHGAAATQTLAKVLLVEKGELGEAAAEALAATGDPSAEPPLLRALEGAPGLRRAAVEALGRVGTPAAVAHLRAAESQDAALRGAARQAIAEIQSRLVDAAPGQLSLAGGEAGRLSIAEDETGRLSLSETPQFKT